MTNALFRGRYKHSDSMTSRRIKARQMPTPAALNASARQLWHDQAQPAGRRIGSHLNTSTFSQGSNGELTVFDNDQIVATYPPASYALYEDGEMVHVHHRGPFDAAAHMSVEPEKLDEAGQHQAGLRQMNQRAADFWRTNAGEVTEEVPTQDAKLLSRVSVAGSERDAAGVMQRTIKAHNAAARRRYG